MYFPGKGSLIYVYCFCSRVEVIELADSEDDDEPEVVFQEVKQKNGQVVHDLIIRNGETTPLDDTSVFKLNNNNHPAFPNEASQKKRRFDEYGETIQ